MRRKPKTEPRTAPITVPGGGLSSMSEYVVGMMTIGFCCRRTSGASIEDGSSMPLTRSPRASSDCGQLARGDGRSIFAEANSGCSGARSLGRAGDDDDSHDGQVGGMLQVVVDDDER